MGGRKLVAAMLAALTVGSLAGVAATVTLAGPTAAATVPAPATTATLAPPTTAPSTTLPPGVGVPTKRGPGLPLAAKILIFTAIGLAVAATAWTLGSRQGRGGAPPG